MDWDDVCIIGKIVAVFALLTFVVIFVAMVIQGQTNLTGDLAQIESLRSDIGKSNAVNNEDIMGQVAEVNRKISEKQAYNSKWWADLVIPDEWDSVKLIEVGEE